MNALALELCRDIARNGPMTFARFMEMALYAPGLGYYEQPRQIGRHGDFYTSVSTGSLFGELLAFQFSEWFDAECSGSPCQLVEAGAHDGRLAVDILEWVSRYRPGLLGRLQYCILESSPVRRGWQEKTLHAYKAHVRWTRDVHEFGDGEVNGIIFSNEFLDALPVHRLAWDASNRRWREWQVTCDAHGLAWHLGLPAEKLFLSAVGAELAGVLPDGFVAEVSPVAVEWWRAAARRLGRGRLVAIDYGFGAEGGLRPDCPRGSLRGFVRHHPSDDLLANPGEQDLTADVNFTALEEAGRAEGLGVGVLARQSKFLTQIMAKTQVKPEGFGAWTEKSSRQFQTLTHPEHLGRSFHCLIQAKGLLALDF